MADVNVKANVKRTSTLGKVKVLVEQVVGSPSQAQINQAVADYIDSHPGSLSPLSQATKSALLDIAAHVAYIDANGQSRYDALDAALNAKALLSITAVYTQSGTVYDTDSLDSLKSDLVVTAYYDDGTSVLVTSGYTLSGELTVGTSTVTVTFGNKTATFNVTVSAPLYVLPSQTVFTGSNTIDTGVHLLETDRDFTIAVNYLTGTPPSSWFAYMLQCMDEVSPYYGITWVASASKKYYTLVGPATEYPVTQIPIAAGHTIKTVLRHIASQDLYEIDYTVDGVRKEQVTATRTKDIVSVADSLWIGAQHKSNGTFSDYWRGTIYDMAVYGEARSDAFVTEYLEQGA